MDTAPNPLLSCEYVFRSNSSNFQFKMIVLREVRDAITEIKTNKGCGNDKISCYFLKLVLQFIEKSLQCCNNRTIALISHCSKVLQKNIAGKMRTKVKDKITEE